jgi:hypothetical protein
MQKKLTIAGIIIGAVVFVLGIVVLAQDTGYKPEYVEFGADFYTYSYSATRYAAGNVMELAEIVKKGLGFLLMAIGAIDACVFGYIYVKNTGKRPAPVVVTTASEMPAENVSDELPEI